MECHISYEFWSLRRNSLAFCLQKEMINIEYHLRTKIQLLRVQTCKIFFVLSPKSNQKN